MPDLQGEQEVIDIVVQEGEAVCFHKGVTFLEVAKPGSEAHLIFCDSLVELFSDPEHREIAKGRRTEDTSVYGNRLSAPMESLRRILDRRGAWQLALVFKQGLNCYGKVPGASWWCKGASHAAFGEYFLDSRERVSLLYVGVFASAMES
jgi:hypothetical protein